MQDAIRNDGAGRPMNDREGGDMKGLNKTTRGRRQKTLEGGGFFLTPEKQKQLLYG